MPFEKGNKLSPGRPTMDLEQEQLERMRKILDKDLKIIERLQDSEGINPVDREKLLISQARVSKYLDKLHVSKTATDVTSGGEAIPILVQFLNGKDKKDDTDTKRIPQAL